MTPFFIGRADFVRQILEYGIVSVRQTYIHFVAQETRIIRKLFIFNFQKNISTFLIKKIKNEYFSDNYAFLGYQYKFALPTNYHIPKFVVQKSL